MCPDNLNSPLSILNGFLCQWVAIYTQTISENKLTLYSLKPGTNNLKLILNYCNVCLTCTPETRGPTVNISGRPRAPMLQIPNVSPCMGR